MNILKIKGKPKGEHIHLNLFMGCDEEHLQNVGHLCMGIGDWQTLGWCLLVGSKEINKHFKVIMPKPDPISIYNKKQHAEKGNDE